MFFGRRLGRPLSPSRQRVLSDVLPAYLIPSDHITQEQDFDPRPLFEKPEAPLIFEIGFGNGEHLAEMLRRDPGRNFIGCEPFKNGMAAFLKETEHEKPQNLRLYMDDALLLVRSLQDACLDEIYILNPDPWHKARHHKRRIVREETVADYFHLLKPGGKLITTTDVPDLADWMITHITNHGGFDWQAQSCKDWQTPPEDWIPTRYETKKAKGADKMTYLFFERKTLANPA